MADPFTLFAGNLPPGTGEADLLALFAPFGEVTAVSLAPTEAAGARDFAYVSFAESADVDEAVFNTHHAEFFGRVLRVERARRLRQALDRPVWDEEAYLRRDIGER